MLRIILALTIGFSGAALAQDKNPDEQAAKEKLNAFAGRLFAGKLASEGKSYACFVRAYDGAHLAAHPLQKVKSMKVLVTAEKDEQPAAPTDSAGLGYSFRMGVTFTRRPGNFDSSGSCGSPGVAEKDGKVSFSCGVDCDGGGIAMEMRDPKDNKSILVRLERIRIWRNNRPEDEGLDLSGGADDRVFRLDRAPVEQCRSLITDRKELAAIRTLKN